MEAAPATARTGMERALKLVATQRSTTKALQEAVSCGDTSGVKMMIRAIKRRDGDEVGGRRVLQLLLAADRRGNTLMHAAAGSWQDGADMVRLLVQHGAGPTCARCNADKRTPLHRAAVANNAGRRARSPSVVPMSAAHMLAAMRDEQGALHCIAASFAPGRPGRCCWRSRIACAVRTTVQSGAQAVDVWDHICRRALGAAQGGQEI